MIVVSFLFFKKKKKNLKQVEFRAKYHFFRQSKFSWLKIFGWELSTISRISSTGGWMERQRKKTEGD